MKHKLYKAEIHVHLEAALPPSLCKKFAKRNNLKISEVRFFIFPTLSYRSFIQWLLVLFNTNSKL